MRALVDGDIIVYRAGFAAEHTRYVLMDEGRPVAGPFDSAAERKEYVIEHQGAEMLISGSYKDYEPVSHALANVKSMMQHLHDEIGECTTYLSKGKCYRHTDIATMLEYKGNRKDAPRPKHYDAIREYLITHYGARVFTSIEADDALAMSQGKDTVICSVDKDLLQVPGLHYNWVRGRDEDYDGTGKVLISEEVGARKLWQQVLTGDGTDNIPGIYRVGEVKARKMIAECEAVVDMVNVTSYQWHMYLTSDLKMPTEGMATKNDIVTYTHWCGARDIHCNTDDIRNEVLRLVKVGGNDAERAATDANEDDLIVRG